MGSYIANFTVALVILCLIVAGWVVGLEGLKDVEKSPYTRSIYPESRTIEQRQVVCAAEGGDYTGVSRSNRIVCADKKGYYFAPKESRGV